MKYKGYTAVVELNDDSSGFFGRVVGLRDVITFQGTSIEELIQAFHDSVDDYLAFCEERGENPEKPYSGQLILRMDPGLHRELAHVAEAKGKSLNSFIEIALRHTLLTYVHQEVLAIRSLSHERRAEMAKVLQERLRGMAPAGRDIQDVLRAFEGTGSEQPPKPGVKKVPRSTRRAKKPRPNTGRAKNDP